MEVLHVSLPVEHNLSREFVQKPMSVHRIITDKTGITSRQTFCIHVQLFELYFDWSRYSVLVFRVKGFLRGVSYVAFTHKHV